MLLENRLSSSTSSLKKWLFRLIFSGLVIGAMVAPQMLIASSKAQEARPRDGRKISFLVEKGFVLPPQSLATLKSLDGSNWEQRPSQTANSTSSPPVIFAEAIELPHQFRTGSSINTGDSHRIPWTTFTISGGGRFESQLADGSVDVVPTENGVIMTPAIVAGSQFGEGFIQVLVDGQPIIENLRVATLEVGDIEKLKKFAPEGNPALLVSGDHYAVLDESKVTSEEAILRRGAGPVATWPGPTWPGPTWPGPTWPGPSGKEPTKQEEAAPAGVQVEPLSQVAGVTFRGGIAAQPMPNGRIEVFAVGPGGAIYHKYQLAPNSGWSAWKSLGGVAYFPDISVAPNEDGRLTIFVGGADGGVWFKYQNRVNDPESWTAWISLDTPDNGYALVSPPVAVLNKRTGCIEVFARNFTYAHKLHRRAQTRPNNGWGSWENLLVIGYALSNTLNAVHHSGVNKTAVFTDDFCLLEKQFAPRDDPYSFFYLPSSMAHLVAESNYNETIGVIGVNFNGLLENGVVFTDENSFSGWGSMKSGRTYHKPAVVRDIFNRLNVFVNGTDNRIYWSRQQYPGAASWDYWIALGGGFKSVRDTSAYPAAAINEDGRLEVFVMGTDRQIYHAYEQTHPGGQWSGFKLL